MFLSKTVSRLRSLRRKPEGIGILLLFFGGLGVVNGADPVLERYEFVRPHMGTLFQVVLFAEEPRAARAAADEAFARVEALNACLSDYDPESELMRLCRQPAGTPVPVSDSLFAVLTQSQAVADLTDGAFDVTVGPLVRLWREARRSGRFPRADQLESCRAPTGHDKLRLENGSRVVTLKSPGMQLDLGGIAKGHAADEALSLLAARGFSRAMVAASGDLALGDPPPGTTGWKVEIVPFGRKSPARRTLLASHVGISTSGDVEQYVEIDGVRYSHIVDPRTGIGLTAPLAVTVVARRAILSDSWSTACSVLGDEEARRAIERVSEEPLFVIVHRRDGEATVPFGRPPPGLHFPL